jgi:hypothetical protein
MTQQSTVSPATGIPNPDTPGRWLVSPWGAEASFHDVVRHFLRSFPWYGASTTHYLAYYRGYQTAIEAAPTHELTHPHDWQWYEDLRDCVGRCVDIYQEKQAEEIQQANGVET